MAASYRVAAPQPSLNCTSYVYSGLKLQSSIVFGSKTPNLNVAFHKSVHKSLHFRTNSKATRARITMMPIGTPRVPYKTPGERSWQWVDLWNALYRERIVWIGQHVDEDFSNQILATMLYLDTVESSKMLYLFLCSPTGDVTPFMSLYDTMQSLESPCGTHCIGAAFNMAGFLLAAGKKGNRTLLPMSRVRLGPPGGAARGQADAIRNEANELLRIRDYLFDELSQNTGQPVERIYKDLNKNKYFEAEEAIDYGLVDRIVRKESIEPDA